MHLVDPSTLVLQKQFDYTELNKRLTGFNSASHYQIDKDTGELFNFVQSPTGAVKVFVITGNNPKGRILAEFNARVSYIHMVLLTQKYFIMIFQPLVYSPLKVLFSGRILDSLNWQKDSTTQIYLISRDTGEYTRYDTSPFFFFHSINAYDENDDVVLDICGYKDSKIIDQFHLKNLERDDQTIPLGQIYRILISREQPVQFSIMKTSVWFDLPKLNESYEAKPYRYFYAVASDGKSTRLFSKISKFDVKEISVKSWECDNCVPAEPIFLATPNSSEEDDGVILSVVLDAVKKESCLVVLDAKSMTEICRAWLRTVMTLNFHGEFKKF